MTARPPPIVRKRLPSLHEVLRRSTRPPVDLYCYYLFLQREGSEDTLDFWLDVQQHENLCRAFFKDVRKSGRHVREEWPRYHEYARTRGSIYGTLTGVKRGEEDGGGELQHGDDQSVSGHGHGHSRENDEKYSLMQGELLANKEGGGGSFDTNDHSRGDSAATAHNANEFGRLSPDSRYANRTPSPAPGSAGAYPLSPTMKALYPHDQETEHLRGTQGSRSGRNNKRTSGPTQPFIPRDAAISRTDLIASAERIYSRYLMPGADKEVYLPPSLRIQEFPLSSSTLPAVSHPDYDYEADAQARVPDMFNEQKEFVHRAMEVDTFPRFLRAKGFANLTPVGALVRLVVGLVSLWAGLATAFAFVFLDTKPRVRRLWIILPFTFAIVNLVAHGYQLDPILVFMGLSETTPFRTIGIREPFVRRLLFGRALWVSFISMLMVAVLTVVFWAVPGHRL